MIKFFRIFEQVCFHNASGHHLHIRMVNMIFDSFGASHDCGISWVYSIIFVLVCDQTHSVDTNCFLITKTRLFKYTENFTSKN